MRKSTATKGRKAPPRKPRAKKQAPPPARVSEVDHLRLQAAYHNLGRIRACLGAHREQGLRLKAQESEAVQHLQGTMAAVAADVAYGIGPRDAVDVQSGAITREVDTGTNGKKAPAAD